MDDSSGLISTGFLMVLFAWLILLLVAGWKMYVKGGQPGWVSIIPFLNINCIVSHRQRHCRNIFKICCLSP